MVMSTTNGAPPQPDKSVWWWSAAGRGFGGWEWVPGGSGLRSWTLVLGVCRLRSILDPGPEGPALNRPKRLVAAWGLSTGACHDDSSQCR
jgi:hypothetical protein